MDSAIGIIGHAGGGKTTLARALARVIDGAQIVSFGDAVRRRVAAQGMDPQNRKVLMKAGQHWVDTDVFGYCRAVLNQQSGDARVLIIEGIRHEKVRAALEELLGDVDFVCVLLKAPRGVLVDRMTTDHDLTTENAEEVLRDPTETQVDQLLLGAADLILDSTNPVRYNVAEVLDWLDERLSRSDVVALADALETFEPEVFSAEEQAGLVNEVSASSDMPLLKEVSERVSLSFEELQALRRARRFIALDYKGQLLVPGFQLRGDELDQDVAEAVSLLSTEMTAWEIVAWMVSGNGLVDGARPLDLPRTELVGLARNELDT
ncbi:nucleoside monophosphate kinase [Umezawaea tangerina]|uniref:Cytidylate kinase n=1 Tax=Umezawaea tangerina TaxID=84725 RepID=A0A2T0T4E6_9PSEU|nr:nucleoside monophosphate kinase [Umezawaea tangerina]PRY40499.1 cytidylate kinase [Umezawaea tangerina]